MSTNTFLYSVNEIKCDGCAKKITEALASYNDDLSVSVNIAQNSVTVAGVGLNPLEIKQSIEAAGFEITKMQSGE